MNNAGSPENQSALRDYLAQYGPYIDQIGVPWGDDFFVAYDAKPASFESRSLHPELRRRPLTLYRIVALEPGFSVNAFRVQPYYNFPGGADRVLFFNEESGATVSAVELMCKGMIVPCPISR